MNVSFRAAAAMVLLTLAAGALGGWLGVAYGARRVAPPPGLHAILHHDLHLTSAQNERVAALEERFAARRKLYRAQMQAANRELAIALETDHTYGPKEQAAIDRFHHAEKHLQEATIRHLLAMRAILTAKQSNIFDRAVYEALTTGSS